MRNYGIGIIGGTGLYSMDEFREVKKFDVPTPYGSPSGSLAGGMLRDVPVVFLPRHGTHHHLLPAEINYRANIYALKSLGVKWIIGASAVGSMREHLRPRDLVIPEQFLDRTRQRNSTFFGDGVAAHVGFADPVCAELCGMISSSCEVLNIPFHRGGTYCCMEGPQFSTRAESTLYRSWGVDVIGMTSLTEAKLAREAEICFATIAYVTDYDCWHETEADVSAEGVLQIIESCTERVRKVISHVVPRISSERTCSCHNALRGAIVTPPQAIGKEARERLGLLIDSYL